MNFIILSIILLVNIKLIWTFWTKHRKIMTMNMYCTFGIYKLYLNTIQFYKINNIHKSIRFYYVFVCFCYMFDLRVVTLFCNFCFSVRNTAIYPYIWRDWWEKLISSLLKEIIKRPYQYAWISSRWVRTHWLLCLVSKTPQSHIINTTFYT